MLTPSHCYMLDHMLYEAAHLPQKTVPSLCKFTLPLSLPLPSAGLWWCPVIPFDSSNFTGMSLLNYISDKSFFLVKSWICISESFVHYLSLENLVHFNLFNLTQNDPPLQTFQIHAVAFILIQYLSLGTYISIYLMSQNKDSFSQSFF